MDQKGFIFTFDAVLALIPLFLTIILISNLSVAPNSQSQVRISQSAQDCLDILAASQIEERTVMESMVLTLKTDKEKGVEEARNLAKPVLDGLIGDKSYQLVETSQLNGTVIVSQGNLDSSPNLSTATRNWEDYTFVLYVGQ
jgi:hypothetical protein